MTPAVLFCLRKPVIKTQPKSAKVKIGAKAKFKVKATGKDVTYQWYYRTSEDGEWVLKIGRAHV